MVKLPRRLYYAYPLGKKISFRIVAEQYINILAKKYKVYRVAEETFRRWRPIKTFPVVIHPMIYLCINNKSTLDYLRLNQDFIIGFEVADTDHISELGVDIVNYADLLIVPSNFCRESYLNSGCKIPVEVVPHILDRVFYRKDIKPKHPFFIRLKEAKRKRNFVLMLFFLWHSGFRKGADLLREVYRELKKTHKNLYLVVKISNIEDPYLRGLLKEGCLVIRGWLKQEDIVALYDVCDIYPLFSRGGGFELNGLEALSRGEIVIAADKGSWIDYLPREFLVPTRGKVKIFRDNLPSVIHDGYGYEIDVDKAVDKIHNILNDLSEWKAKARYYAKIVRERFSEKRVGERLINLFEKYIE
ncbi:hypothetical protein DRN38_00085 [Thermococci archaeon]|nr:MAG: hypothetical protein DRN38_00085 [Thermococci archaeon]